MQVDVTDGTVDDIFIPQINLYLRRRYKAKLEDTRLMSAKYKWGVTRQHTISNITYELIYNNTNQAEFLFSILIDEQNHITVLHEPKETITPTTQQASDTPSETAKD